jgi:hypothetical protein
VLRSRSSRDDHNCLRTSIAVRVPSVRVDDRLRVSVAHAIAIVDLSPHEHSHVLFFGRISTAIDGDRRWS